MLFIQAFESKHLLVAWVGLECRSCIR